MDLQVGQEVFIVDRYGNRKDRIKQIGRKYVHAEFNGVKFCFGHLEVKGTMVTVFKKNKPKSKRYSFFDVFFRENLYRFINEVKVVDGEK